MRTYQTKARTSRDGMLHLEVACGLADTELEVVVIMEPANGHRQKMGRDDWRRFVAETAGSIPDPTFARHPQGRLEEREPLE